MKDFLPIAVFANGMMAQVSADTSFWERLVERWGIGLVGMVLFYGLARWTMKRDEEDRKKRDTLEAGWQEERINLLKTNNELLNKQIDQGKEHSKQMQDLVKEGHKAASDHASALRMLARKVKATGNLVGAIDENE